MASAPPSAAIPTSREVVLHSAVKMTNIMIVICSAKPLHVPGKLPPARAPMALPATHVKYWVAAAPPK
jgi:hypothetical protein